MKKILLFICLLFMGVASVSALSTTAYYDVLTKNITATQVANGNYDREQASILKKELNAVIGSSLSTSGAYGTNTVKYVKLFQKSYGLSQTGYINKATRVKLNEVYLMDSMIVIKNGAAIRDKAGFTGTKVIGSYNKGKIIKIISRTYVDSRYWYKFYYNGSYGYMSEKNLEGTFIEIEIVSQTMRFYKNRKLYVDTPIVTGRADGIHDTLKGYFWANDKAKNPTTHTQYSIQIGDNSGQFIHDLVYKRGEFANYVTYGGTIYSNLNYPSGNPNTGSLGCVNTPLQRIKPIYSNVKAANLYPSNPTPIYVH